jgi:hypothetical protein
MRFDSAHDMEILELADSAEEGRHYQDISKYHIIALIIADLLYSSCRQSTWPGYIGQQILNGQVLTERFDLLI